MPDNKACIAVPKAIRERAKAAGLNVSQTCRLAIIHAIEKVEQTKEGGENCQVSAPTPDSTMPHKQECVE
jgi:post-segregation antitoxin (ccd killing protein)